MQRQQKITLREISEFQPYLGSSSTVPTTSARIQLVIDAGRSG